MLALEYINSWEAFLKAREADWLTCPPVLAARTKVYAPPSLGLNYTPFSLDLQTKKITMKNANTTKAIQGNVMCPYSKIILFAQSPPETGHGRWEEILAVI